MRKLNLKKTTLGELKEKWGFKPLGYSQQKLFIRCNAKGDINCEVAPVYRAEELVGRDNVKVLE